MLVVHAIPTIARNHGGPSEVVRQLLERDAGSVAVTTRRELAPSEMTELGPRAVYCRPVGPRRLNLARGVWAAMESVRTPSLVHIHSGNTAFSTQIAAWCSRRRVPFIVQPHGVYDSSQHARIGSVKHTYNRIDRVAFRNAARLVASSTREAAGLERVLGRTPEVIPLGVDPRLRVLDDGRRRKVVLFLGRLAAVKRVDLLLEAFARSRAAADGWRLVVAGPVDQRLAFDPTGLARRLGLGGSVEFPGPVDASDRLKLLAEARIFVLPSDSESFGMAAAEAMAAGCAPIFSRNIAAANDMPIRDSLLIVESDATALAGAIDSLASNLEWQKWREPIRDAARQRFDWDRIAYSFRDLYGRAVQGQ